MANQQLTRNLYKYRKSHNYTQDKVSQYLSISRQAYSNYELRKRDPDIDLLMKLCKLYQITLDQLVLESFSSNHSVIREVTEYKLAEDVISNSQLYITADEIKLLLDFRDTTPENQAVIRHLLDFKK